MGALLSIIAVFGVLGMLSVYLYCNEIKRDTNPLIDVLRAEEKERNEKISDSHRL